MGAGVSDEKEGADAQASAMPDTSGLALDLAMEEARSDPSLREHVAAFLTDQRALIADQRHHMRKQFGLGLWEKRLGVLLRGATVFVGIVLASGFGILIWNAAHSNELVVDSFSVPPDLAEKGITGEVLAGDLVDRVTAIANRSRNSARAPQSYSNSFGDGIKFEIPETGVSLGELDRFLRAQLGHDTHIGGALVHAGTDLKLTVRVGAAGSDNVVGKDSEFDALVQRAAEAVYRRTQPYRYGTLMFGRDRQDEAKAVYQELTQSDSITEQAWATVGLGNLREQTDEASLALFKHAAELDPGNALAVNNIAFTEYKRGRWELTLADNKKLLELLSRADQGQIVKTQVESYRLRAHAVIASLQGDYLEAERGNATVRQLAGANGGNRRFMLARYQASAHNLKVARATNVYGPQDITIRDAARDTAMVSGSRIAISAMGEDWAGVMRERAALEPLIAAHFYLQDNFDLPTVSLVALAEAHLGRFAAAEARLKPTPADCYPCLIARAQVAGLQGQHARADWWFARAVAQGPSLPITESEWGHALLKRKQPDAAIAQFTLANMKGPKFADPLQGWGEALMAKNQSHRALVKFAEAEKYAPNWGRLHLKWGEALAYSGDKTEAAKHFARAAALDLTPSEKQELARQL